MRALLVFPLLFLLLAFGAVAQPLAVSDAFPVSDPFTPYDPDDWRLLYDPAVTALSTGDFAVVWAWETRRWSQIQENGISGLLVDASGEKGPRFSTANNWADPYEQDVACPAIAALAGGGFVVAHSEGRWAGRNIYLVWLGRDASVVGDLLLREGEEGMGDGCPELAGNTAGHLAMAWPEEHYSFPHASARLLAQVFSPAGEPVVPWQTLDEPVSFDEELPAAVGMDSSGRSTVAWHGPEPGWKGRRFAPDGTLMGEPFGLSTTTLSFPVLAQAPGGSFVFGGGEPAPSGQPSALVLRRFRADGAPAGPAVTITRSIEGGARLAADRHGNFAVVWYEKDDGNRLQLFNASLVPQGEPVQAGAVSVLALADNGRLLTVWGAFFGDLLQGRLFRARHEADLCVYRDRRFLCDTAGEGLATEEIPFGFGVPVHTPLLGDVDGDGRADPCLWRRGVFVCDTAHDGTAGEIRIRFGRPADAPLLGDLDGDGRADPCIRRAGRLLCDLAHDGGPAELDLPLPGQPANPLLLGDVDGDGRSDPCVARTGLLFCDTGHDGGRAEVRLNLRPFPGGATEGVPLLGDADGDGRADACLLRGGSLLCGLFSARGGRPLSVLERGVFAEPGDVPLFGDLDAF